MVRTFLLRHGLLALALASPACAEEPPVVARSPAPPTAASAASPPRANPDCDTTKSALQVRLKAGQTSLTPTGVEVTFVRAGHDDFAGGRFDDWVELRFRRKDETASRLVSVYGEQRVEELLGVCWTLRTGGSEEVVVTLYPRATDVTR